MNNGYMFCRLQIKFIDEDDTRKRTHVRTYTCVRLYPYRFDDVFELT